MKRTPMVRKTPLAAGKPLARGGFLKRGAFVPKAPTVSSDERRARTLLKARSGGICEMDGTNPATDACHRVARSQGGAWAVENLLHGCRACHAHCHSCPAQANEVGWILRSHQDPTTEPAWLLEHGWVILLPDGGLQKTERKEAA